jgi:hypothetical protein
MASMVGDVVTAAGWAALREAGDGRVDSPAAAIRHSRMCQGGRASLTRDIHTGCGVCEASRLSWGSAMYRRWLRAPVSGRVRPAGLGL